MKNDREQRMDVMEIEEEEGHSHFFLAQDVFELEEEYLGTFPREPYCRTLTKTNTIKEARQSFFRK